MAKVSGQIFSPGSCEEMLYDLHDARFEGAAGIAVALGETWRQFWGQD